MRVLVCGSRKFTDPRAAGVAIFERIRQLPKDSTVIHGGALGADQIAEGAALLHNFLIQRFDADWDKHGKAAGVIRNIAMLRETRPRHRILERRITRNETHARQREETRHPDRDHPLPMIDILYVSFNRLAYVKQTFPALLANTDWSLVNRLYICDDASTDGTAEYLREWLPRLDDMGIQRRFISTFGGPVAALNLYLDEAHDNGDSDRLAKIDSDFVVCPGWLPEVLHQMTIHPGVDVFGLQPRFGPSVAPTCLHRTVEQARFIGGIGAIRHRVFDLCRPRPSGEHGYQGWTTFQTAHPFKKAWLIPDLPCFCLDLLPFEPWVSLTQSYIDAGWMRAWPKYDLGSASESYWAWWLSEDPERRT